MTTDTAITPLELTQRLAEFPPPTLVDVRRRRRSSAIRNVIPGAHPARARGRRRPGPPTLEPWRPVVVYCVHGHEVGQRRRGRAARARLRRALPRGRPRSVARRAATRRAVSPTPTRWVTRERPKIDRIACPWLVRRFIDPAAEFFYVPSARGARVRRARNGATPYDIAGRRVRATRRALQLRRVHRASTSSPTRRSTASRRSCAAPTPARSTLAPQAPGLLAASLGLSRDVRRRSRDAASRDARVRRALRVVPAQAQAERTRHPTAARGG